MKRLVFLVLLLLAQPAVAGIGNRPALYALVVGVTSVKDAASLHFPAKDAADLAAALNAQNGKAFRSVEVRQLVDGQATKDSILDGLDWLSHQTTAHDVAMVVLIGQGVNEPRTGRYYFVPADGDSTAVKRTLLSSADVHDALASISGKAVLLLDACRPGTVGARKLECKSDLEWLGTPPGPGEHPVAVLTAATAGQGSAEDQELGNGALAKAVIEALKGTADAHRSGAVSVEMLERYVLGRVRELTHGAQVPVSANFDALGGLSLAQDL